MTLIYQPPGTDLFEVGADVLVNATNVMGVMGGGIALGFKNRFPDMFASYFDACRRREHTTTRLHVFAEGPTTIVNLATKYDPRKPSKYSYVATGLKALRGWIKENANQRKFKIAVPALGCGLGGLDWWKVNLLIERWLGGLKCDVLVFPPH